MGLGVGAGTDAGPGTTRTRARGQSGPGTVAAGWQVNGAGLTGHGGEFQGDEVETDNFRKS